MGVVSPSLQLKAANVSSSSPLVDTPPCILRPILRLLATDGGELLADGVDLRRGCLAPNVSEVAAEEEATLFLCDLVELLLLVEFLLLVELCRDVNDEFLPRFLLPATRLISMSVCAWEGGLMCRYSYGVFLGSVFVRFLL